MTKLKPLNHKHLRQCLDPSTLKFESTNEIKSLSGLISQNRALQALMFGIGIKSDGYNMYAMGAPGIGKRLHIKNIINENLSKLPVPYDWCYVHNFINPNKPIALKLKAGRGELLKHDMEKFIHDSAVSMLAIFEGEKYKEKLKKIRSYYEKKRARIVDDSPELIKSQNLQEQKLRKTSVADVIGNGIKKLRKKYGKNKSVKKYLSAVHQDIINHIDDFIINDEKSASFSMENPALIKYKINLIVSNKNKSVPVIFEENPTYSNLICRVEYVVIHGFPTTNFMLIKGGSLHQANGGYLIIEARKIKNNDQTWEALKSILYEKKIAIKPPDEDSRFQKPVSLDPMPIPLNVKIILIGSRGIYYSFCEKDHDFIQLFKVPVDFDEQIPRNSKNINLYTRLIATIVQENSLLPFHASAVAEIIDYSTRLAADIEKLSTHVRSLRNIILESDFSARKSNKKLVRSPDVKQALQASAYRMDRARELYYEEIRRDFIIINTDGKSIGQVNCLSVRRVGDFCYGHPTRVTARVRAGKGRVMDIQREIKMAGPFHSKAILTITNFLSGKFVYNKRFNLHASVSFEQVYVWTDGDSASVGELCALLSSIAEVPICQNFAITGSIDQYGEVQAVGGINEKIEGFFDVCKERGLNGKHAILMPAINIKNLMLREDIVKAVKAGKFLIYPITHIDEAISHLTGMEAGTRNKQGFFEAHTLYHLVEKRLEDLAKK